MIPGLETLLGSLLGGVFRFGTAWMEAREKARERDHELNMLRLNGELAEKADDRRLREVGLAGEIRLSEADLKAMVSVNRDQADMARAMGGVAGFLSATVRPVATYLLLTLYIAHKTAHVAAAWGDEGALAAIASAYADADMALLSGILGFWFVDRALRHSGMLGSRA